MSQLLMSPDITLCKGGARGGGGISLSHVTHGPQQILTTWGQARERLAETELGARPQRQAGWPPDFGALCPGSERPWGPRPAWECRGVQETRAQAGREARGRRPPGVASCKAHCTDRNTERQGAVRDRKLCQKKTPFLHLVGQV